jgi:3-hydroxybutyryl-CoA dehydratase
MTGPEHGLPRPVAHELGDRAIGRYAELSGDNNPLHVDPDYAARTSFGGTIAHGPLGLQPFFESLCDWLGLESLPVGARVKADFRAPVPSGSTVTCEFTGRDTDAGGIVLHADCRLETGATAVELEATLPLEDPEA